MEAQNEMYRIMSSQTEIALATSVENCPNVRLVNFIFDEEKKVIYFATFGDNEKVKEFLLNGQIAFTTVPYNGNEHVRGRGLVRPSEMCIFDVKDAFIEKIMGYASTIEQVGDYLVLYEITFECATVTLDFEKSETVRLKFL